MNKRTLLVALVLLSVACAYASTVTIIYPTPVEGLASHEANTTTAHDTAGTNATLASHASSLATLSADVVTRANINGSSTQNFSVATGTFANVSMPLIHAYVPALFGPITTNTNSNITFGTSRTDIGGGWDGTTYTVPSSGNYRISCTLLPYIASGGQATNSQLLMTVNGVEKGHVDWYSAATAALVPLVYCGEFPLKAGDTVVMKFGFVGAAVANSQYITGSSVDYSWIIIDKIR
jgi:hypothetical protein